jgi:hypothetical protein
MQKCDAGPHRELGFRELEGQLAEVLDAEAVREFGAI